MTERANPATPEQAGGAREGLPGLTHRLVRLVPVYWVVFLAALIAFFFTREQGELRQLNRVVRTARIDWLLLAVAIECAIVVLMAFEQQLLLRRLRAPVGLLPLLDVFFRRQLLATVLPFGNVTSNVQFVRALGRRNVETGDALFASILFSVLGTVSLAVFAMPVLLWLAVDREVSRAMLAGSGLLLATVGLLGVTTWTLLRAAGPLEWAVRRIPHRIGGFVAQTRAHGVTVRDLRLPFALALAIDVLGGTMLYAVLRSLAIAPSPSAAFGGYLVGTIFVLVAPVFQGLGFVELSMTVALQHFGVPAAAALGATLLYRFCELWLPFVVGLAIQSSTSRGVRALPPASPRSSPVSPVCCRSSPSSGHPSRTGSTASRVTPGWRRPMPRAPSPWSPVRP